MAGVGPLNQSGWAQLTLSIQLDRAATRMNRQLTVMTRTVRFNQIGMSVGRVWEARWLREASRSPTAAPSI